MKILVKGIVTIATAEHCVSHLTELEHIIPEHVGDGQKMLTTGQYKHDFTVVFWRHVQCPWEEILDFLFVPYFQEIKKMDDGAKKTIFISF